MPETSPIASVTVDESADEAVSAPQGEPGQGSDSADGTNSGPFYDDVAKVVKIIRPAVQADNGDIFLRAVNPETGVVSVELVGACVTCPASSQTLKDGLERILKDRVEGVTSVQHVGANLVGYDNEGTAVSL